jgi:hypothetical protein
VGSAPNPNGKRETRIVAAAEAASIVLMLPIGFIAFGCAFVVRTERNYIPARALQST